MPKKFPDVKDCHERKESFERKNKIIQYRKIYNRYRVPNYRKYNNYQYHQFEDDNISDNEITNNDQSSSTQQPKETENIAKEQGKGNFDDQTRQIYALFK